MLVIIAMILVAILLVLINPMLLFVAIAIALIGWIIIHILVLVGVGTSELNRNNRDKNQKSKAEKMAEKKLKESISQEFEKNEEEYAMLRKIIIEALEIKGHPIRLVHENFMYAFDGRNESKKAKADELFILMYCFVMKNRNIFTLNGIPLIVIRNFSELNSRINDKQYFDGYIVPNSVLSNRYAKVDSSFDPKDKSYANISKAYIAVQEHNDYPKIKPDKVYANNLYFDGLKNKVLIKMKGDDFEITVDEEIPLDKLNVSENSLDGDLEKITNRLTKEYKMLVKTVFSVINSNSRNSGSNGIKDSSQFRLIDIRDNSVILSQNIRYSLSGSEFSFKTTKEYYCKIMTVLNIASQFTDVKL